MAMRELDIFLVWAFSRPLANTLQAVTFLASVCDGVSDAGTSCDARELARN